MYKTKYEGKVEKKREKNLKQQITFVCYRLESV